MIPGAQTLNLPFEALLSVLESRGFRVGIEQRARLHQLLGDSGFRYAPERLKTMLCPIFASDDGQQEEFYQIFDEFFPNLAKGETISTSTLVSLPPKQRNRKRFWLIVAVNILWLGILAYTGWRIGPGANRQAAPGKGTETGTCPWRRQRYGDLFGRSDLWDEAESGSPNPANRTRHVGADAALLGGSGARTF